MGNYYWTIGADSDGKQFFVVLVNKAAKRIVYAESVDNYGVALRLHTKLNFKLVKSGAIWVGELSARQRNDLPADWRIVVPYMGAIKAHHRLSDPKLRGL